MGKKRESTILVQEQESWLHIEDLIHHAVVHVFAQIVQFNWLEPYKTDVEYEKRGTGFFIDEQGDIVTTAHVVDEAKRVWVQIPFLGWQSIAVEVIRFCPDRDIALLRIIEPERERILKQVKQIAYLALGNSDDVRHTDKVLVMGYPLGQYHVKSTTGIISGREFIEGTTFLQITAPVNPGNSGGPVLNVYGQVIGIAVASVVEAANVGYAIPIDELIRLLEDMTTTPLVRKQALGVRFNMVNDEAAHYLGNPIPAGAYVNAVFKNSLAERAGLQQGDMLYQCNGYPIDACLEMSVPWSQEKITLYDLIARFKIGDAVELELYRSGKKMVKKFTFEQSPLYPIRMKYPDYELVDYEIIAGIVFMELSENHLAFLLEEAPHLEWYMRIENKYDSVVIITYIFPGSVASQLRSLFPGDILKGVNGIEISTLADMRRALPISSEQKFLTLVTRNNNALAVFNMEQVLSDEARLAKDYGYRVSSSVQKIRRKYIHGSKKAT